MMEHLLTSVEVAKILGVTEGTLRNWRYQGDGPAYVKLGSAVRYKAADVQAYIDSLPYGA